MYTHISASIEHRLQYGRLTARVPVQPVGTRTVQHDSLCPLTHRFPETNGPLYHIYIDNHEHKCVYVYIRIYLHTHICTRTYIYIYVRMYIYIHMYRFMYACMYVCMYVCIHTYIHTYMHTYIHIYYIHLFYAYIHQHTACNGILKTPNTLTSP